MNVKNNLSQAYYNQYKDDRFFNNQYEQYKKQLVQELDSDASDVVSMPSIEAQPSAKTDYTDREDEHYS